MACTHCRLPYPDELLSDFVTPNGRARVCGVCALDLTNALHGTKMKRFHGEGAEFMRQEALEWRRRHPKAQAVPV